MICSKCGKELPDSAAFCTACGTPVSQAINPDEQETVSTADVQNTYTFTHTRDLFTIPITYLTISTSVEFGHSSLQITSQKPWFSFQCPEVHITVPYKRIAWATFGTAWSLRGLVVSIFLAIASLATSKLYGLIFAAIALFCAYDHAIILTVADEKKPYGTKHYLYGVQNDLNNQSGSSFLMELQKQMESCGAGDFIDPSIRDANQRTADFQASHLTSQPAGSKQCPYCKAFVKQENLFCTKCGKKFEEKSQNKGD